MAPIESPDAAKAPAFQFYPKDFLGDGDQAGMSLQESGAYARLMCFEWNAHGKGLPDDAERCGRMVGATLGAMRKMWPALRSLFETHPSEPGRIVHPRLEKERQKQAEFKRRQSDKGKAGATSRWGTTEHPKHGRSMAGAKPKDSRGMAGPMAEAQPDDGSSVSSLQSSDSGLKTNTALSRVRDEGFEAFWQIYPKRRSRGDAEKAWKKIKPSPDLVTEILEAVRAQRQSVEWQKDGGQFIPYPASWLNAKRWEDETDRPSAAAMGSRTLALVNATAGFLAGGKS